MREKNLSTKKAFDLAFQKLNKGNFKDAESIYKEILKTEPNHIGTHNNLGIIFTYLKEFEKAKTCFKKVIEINPNYSDAYVNLGKIFKKLKNNSKAKDYFEKALKIKLIKSPEVGLFVYNEMNHRGFFLDHNLEQIKKGKEQLPLLTWPLLDFIKTLDLKNITLHELGSGNSTIWFSNIFDRVKSYETNLDWYNNLKPKLKTNVSLKLIDLKNLYNCSLKFKTKDWLLIDFAGKRTKFVHKLIKFSDDKIPAQIIFDNSELYRNGAKILTDRGYVEISFYGFKSGEQGIHCTSLFLLKKKFKVKVLQQFFYPKFSSKIQNDWDTID